MLGVDQRVLKIVWTVFLFAAMIALVYAIRDALITFALAIFLALLLSPLVSIVDHFTSVRVPRTVALMVVYVLMIAAFAAVLMGMISAVAVDARSLSVRLPDALRDDPLGGLPLPAWLDSSRERLAYWMHEQLNQLGDNALAIIGQGLQQLFTKLGAAVGAVLVPILAFFFYQGRQKTTRRVHS